MAAKVGAEEKVKKKRERKGGKGWEVGREGHELKRAAYKQARPRVGDAALIKTPLPK